jgi:Spy/CpxP family protein refolding chaperone
MKRWILGGIAVTLSVLGLGLFGWAQGRADWGRGFRGRGEWRMGHGMMALLENSRMKAALGLTDQQADQLHQLFVESEKSTVKTRADIAIRDIEMRELLRADKPDREAIMKKVQELSDLRGQMMKQHIESLLAARSVLTPEQQNKIRSLLERRRSEFRRERFRGQRGPGRTERPAGPPESRRPETPPVQ